MCQVWSSLLLGSILFISIILPSFPFLRRPFRYSDRPFALFFSTLHAQNMGQICPNPYPLFFSFGFLSFYLNHFFPFTHTPPLHSSNLFLIPFSFPSAFISIHAVLVSYLNTRCCWWWCCMTRWAIDWRGWSNWIDTSTSNITPQPDSEKDIISANLTTPHHHPYKLQPQS